jgi:glycosyltransferase involved in cell wall biosynthesis
MKKKLISIVTGCFNEEDNVEELYARIQRVMSGLKYQYEHIYIDNASTDGTAKKLRTLAANDKRVKVILNTRNFGHIRSPFYAILQAKGDAVIGMASDLQDPPERIPEFLQKWEEGYLVVVGVKEKSESSVLLHLFRTLYYRFLHMLSEINLIENFTGFGLYDRKVIDIVKGFDDPYPYFRGMIADLGFDVAKVIFTQPRRKRGLTKNNFYTLYDLAMLGLTSYTKVPLRIAAMFGFSSALGSFLIGLVYLVYKLIYWYQFSVGSAPLVIGLFFLGSIQLMFLGIVGEYIGAIFTQVMHRPLVIEKERINF